MARRLSEDVAALAAMRRDSAGAGERASAVWIVRRLRALGVEDVAIEPFRAPRTCAWAHGAHAAAGLVAALRGSRALALAALVSYELEVSGRLPWLRRFLPADQGENVVALLPAVGPRRRTLVLVAHHDAARSGIVGCRWPAGAPFALATLATATGTRAGRAAGGAVQALALAALLAAARSPVAPGANDNASGVAGLLELARRLTERPLDGVEVLLAFTGAHASGMGGMAGFLDEHPLEPGTTFVLGLGTIGSGRPVVATGEATLLVHRYRGQDVALVERAARGAGFAPPERRRLGTWTDPILATYRGLPAASLRSVGPDGRASDRHGQDDVPERVDLACVERCVDVAEAVARVL